MIKFIEIIIFDDNEFLKLIIQMEFRLLCKIYLFQTLIFKKKWEVHFIVNCKEYKDKILLKILVFILVFKFAYVPNKLPINTTSKFLYLQSHLRIFQKLPLHLAFLKRKSPEKQRVKHWCT